MTEFEVLQALAAGVATDAHLDHVVEIDGTELPVRDLSQAQILRLRDRNAF